MAPSTGSPPPPPALLLLPPPPTPSTRLALTSSYRAPLTAVLSALAVESRQSCRPVLLLIAIACPVLAPSGGAVRWRAAQTLLAGIYSIVAAVCAEQGVQTDLGAAATATTASVDARVVLVDHARGRTYRKATTDGSFARRGTVNNAAVLDLAGFATRVTGPWTRIYHPSSEAGYELLRAYLDLAEGRQVVRQDQIVPVPGGIGLSTAESAAREVLEEPDKSYDTVILGGTFDHLHPGHKLLLHGTALLMRLPESHDPASPPPPPSTLIVGVSGAPMLRTKKYADELESWEARCRGVLSFLATIFNVTPPSSASAAATPPPLLPPGAGQYRVDHVLEGPSGGPELHGTYADGAVRVRCTVLNDPFGPTVDERAIGAICVSGETRGGGRAVNDKRAAKGWHLLDAYEVDVLDTRGIVEGDAGGRGEETGEENFAAKISSTAIRQQRAEARVKAKAQI